MIKSTTNFAHKPVFGVLAALLAVSAFIATGCGRGGQDLQERAPSPRFAVALASVRAQADNAVETKNAPALYKALRKIYALKAASDGRSCDTCVDQDEKAIEGILRENDKILSREDYDYFVKNEMVGAELKTKEVALTFDDGPHGTLTPEIMKLALDNKIPAAFFEVGNRVAAMPSITRKLAQAGFIIANHTWDHSDLTTLSDAAVTEKIISTQKIISQTLGGPEFFLDFFQNRFAQSYSEGNPEQQAAIRQVAAPEFFRAPYGARSTRVLKLIRDIPVSLTGEKTNGLNHVMWYVDSLDWADGNEQRIVKRVFDQLDLLGHKGVMLFHDIHPQTLRALRIVLPRMIKEGYHFVTLYDVLKAHEAALRQPQPAVKIVKP